jgi:hypothetical protein
MNLGKLLFAAALAASFSTATFAQSTDDTAVPVPAKPQFLQEANEVFYPPNNLYFAPNDVNGDGVSDLLWFNAEKSQIGYWLTDKTSSTSAYVRGPTKIFNVKRGYYVGAVGDFNGDFKADLILTNAKRELYLWESNGTSFDSTHIGRYPEGWQLLGAGDIDGDGNADLLWWNESKCEFGYWLMHGATVAKKTVVKATCGYHVAAIGHFMQTTHLDLLWTSDAHDAYLWAGSDTGFTSTLLGNYDPQGRIVGAALSADFSAVNVYVQNDAALEFTQYAWVRYYDNQGQVSQTTFNPVRSLPLKLGDYLGATGNFDNSNEGVLVWANDTSNMANTPKAPGGLTWYTSTFAMPFFGGWNSAPIASYPAGWTLIGARN